MRLSPKQTVFVSPAIAPSNATWPRAGDKQEMHQFRKLLKIYFLGTIFDESDTISNLSSVGIWSRVLRSLRHHGIALCDKAVHITPDIGTENATSPSAGDLPYYLP